MLMPSLSCHYDAVTLFFLVLLAVLFGRHAVLCSRDSAPDRTRSQIDGAFLTLGAALALLCFRSYAGILVLGGVMYLLSAGVVPDGRQRYRAGIGLLAVLVIYALYPFFWQTVAVIFCLCWPLCQSLRNDDEKRFVALLLSVAFIHQSAKMDIAADSLNPVLHAFYASRFTIMLVILSLFFASACFRGGGGRIIPLWRGLILLLVMEIARENGMGASAASAFEALVIDILLQFFAVICPASLILQFIAPPLPGFMVLWLGLHAILGLSSGDNGWSFAALVLLTGFTVLMVLDSVTLWPERHSEQNRSYAASAGLVTLAMMLPSLGVLAGTMLDPLSMGRIFGLSWRQTGDILLRFYGGDGAVLALPLIWVILLPLWLLTSRTGISVPLGQGAGFPQNFSKDLSDHLCHFPFQLPIGRIRRLQVIIHYIRSSLASGRNLFARRKRAGQSDPDQFYTGLLDHNGDGSVMIWLCFLGITLLALGLSL